MFIRLFLYFTIKFLCFQAFICKFNKVSHRFHFCFTQENFLIFCFFILFFLRSYPQQKGDFLFIVENFLLTNIRLWKTV